MSAPSPPLWARISMPASPATGRAAGPAPSRCPRLGTGDGRVRRWDGYAATGRGAAAAERLIRVTRLAEIETALPAAAAAVEGAGRATEKALANMRSAREAADEARRAEAEAG